mgnify:CR=1 FL=1
MIRNVEIDGRNDGVNDEMNDERSDETNLANSKRGVKGELQRLAGATPVLRRVPLRAAFHFVFVVIGHVGNNGRA